MPTLNQVVLSLISLLQLVSSEAFAQPSRSIRVVAVQDSVAPGAGSAVFENFNWASINGDGKVAFVGLLDGLDVDGSNSTGVWAESSEGLRLIIRTGDTIEEVFGPPLIRSDGRVAVYGSPPDASNSVWSEDNGPLALIESNTQRPAMNPSGRIVFSSSLPSTLWIRDPGDPPSVHLTGDGIAPGIPEGIEYFSFDQVAVVDDGTLFFASPRVGLWSSVGIGDPTPVARIPYEPFVPIVGFTEIHHFTVNTSGQAFLSADSQDSEGRLTRGGLWITSQNASPRLIGSSGSSADAIGETFAGLGSGMFLDDQGTAYFGALLESDPSTDDGIWVDAPEGPNLIARQGHPVPGHSDLTIQHITDFSVNRDGKLIAFLSVVDESGASSSGLWLLRKSGDFAPILQTGDSLDVGIEDRREVTSVTSVSSGRLEHATGSDGRSSIFSAAGDVVVSVDFKSPEGQFTSSSALLVVNVNPLIVNSVGDAEDNNVEDGVCDTGGKIEGDPECTFRAALMQANAREGRDKITFDIPESGPGYDPSSGTWTISPRSALPPIDDPVTIAGPAGTALPALKSGATKQTADLDIFPLITLDGTEAGEDADGLVFLGNESGLDEALIEIPPVEDEPVVSAVVQNPEEGAEKRVYQRARNARGSLLKDFAIGGYHNAIILRADNLRVRRAHVGVSARGAALNNRGVGIRILASGCVIGGALGEGNLISGNTVGIAILGAANTHNEVEGNDIGTAGAFRNIPSNVTNKIGIQIQSSNNRIGRRGVGARGNVISGNTSHGIVIVGRDAKKNTVMGNHIGVLVVPTLGYQDPGNGGAGVLIRDASENTVGGLANKPGSPPGNVISVNSTGVMIQTAQNLLTTKNIVQGNLIGTNAAGDAAVGNNDGVAILNALENTIGGTVAQARNIISGNKASGIFIRHQGALLNRVQGNYIGTDISGTKPIPNGINGVFILDAPENVIGGPTNTPGLPPGNLVSGNRFNIHIERRHGMASGNRIEGNLIGLKAGGDEPMLDGECGIWLNNSRNNVVGGSESTRRNVILGKEDAISIFGDRNVDVPEGEGNDILGNYIGLRATGAGFENNLIVATAGIRIRGAEETVIGDVTDRPGSPPGNVIAGVFLGIWIDGDNCRVAGNIIGLDAGGNKIRNFRENFGPVVQTSGNIVGIEIEGTNNLIGGATDPENMTHRNVISGNHFAGIKITRRTTRNRSRILGNYIGVGLDGKTAIGNGSGINILGDENEIGGLRTSEATLVPPGNVIAGNRDIGVRISGNANIIAGNLIGPGVDRKAVTDATNNTVGNRIGVAILGNDNVVGILGSPNTISGNQTSGVVFSGRAKRNKVFGNAIGSSGGAAPQALPNRSYGIHLFGVSHNEIGRAKRGNQISNNTEGGIFLVNTKKNEISHNTIEISKTGVLGDNAKNDRLLFNTIQLNKRGIDESRNSHFDVLGNIFLLNDRDRSSIHLNGSTARIIGNSITQDAGDGITLENGSTATIRQNIIVDNDGFGVHNTDDTISILANGNWWGDASGPGGEGPGTGDEISRNVVVTDWLGKMVPLVLAPTVDTLFVVVGETDSLDVLVRNWANPTETVDVVLTDARGWVRSETRFTLALEEDFGAASTIALTVPAGAEMGANTVTVSATSHTDPTTVVTDSFLVLSYVPVLNQILVFPDSLELSPGDSVLLSADGIDQTGRLLTITPTWDATGGTIDSTGFFVRSRIPEPILVTATDPVTGLQAQVELTAVGTGALPGDFDGSGTVDFPDFLQFASAFGSSQEDPDFDALFDLDGDNAVGFGDFLIFALNFGQSSG